MASSTLSSWNAMQLEWVNLKVNLQLVSSINYMNSTTNMTSLSGQNQWIDFKMQMWMNLNFQKWFL
jgi:hypothetical protein